MLKSHSGPHSKNRFISLLIKQKYRENSKWKTVNQNSSQFTVQFKGRLYSNNKARSCNHCCSGKGTNITYSECVCVCVCSLCYPACKAHAPHCHLWPSPLYNIFPHYLIKGTIFRKKLMNTKCVFGVSLQIFPETLLILGRTERDMVKNIHRSACTVPLFLSDFNETCFFPQIF